MRYQSRIAIKQRDGEIMMKKFLLGTIGLLALGMAAPATAADLAARPYTKAPPPIVAPIYDWTGFYIGANGGWGSSHKCWDDTNFLFVRSPAIGEGCHNATGGTMAVRSDTAGRPATGCSVWKRRATGLI